MLPRVSSLIFTSPSKTIIRINLKPPHAYLKTTMHTNTTTLCPTPTLATTSTDPNLLKPPEIVKNMQTLDKTKFEKPVTIPYIDLKDSKISEVLPRFKTYLLKLENFKPIIIENCKTIMHLNPLKITQWDDIDSTDRDFLKLHEIDSSCYYTKTLTLLYENYKAEDIFRAVLPCDKEGMASFTKVGHIVHVNLREHLLPFKSIIGQVLLDKISNCKTVVNKVNIIDSTYRNFQMEVLCGESNFMARLKENRCVFEFDFSTVYWNSRLCTEHERVVNMVKPDDVLFDVFAGVGPFSVPIAKRKCTVFANDLNPESYKWLVHNAKINKVGGNLKMFNKDGRDFILNELKSNLLQYKDRKVHIVMNLPAMATEFLSAFYKMYTLEEVSDFSNYPMVYCYCFAKGEDPEGIARRLVVQDMGVDIADKIVDIFKVRTVSSMKEMIRVTIKLDRDILLGHCKRKCETDCDNKAKKCLAMGKNKGNKKTNNVFKVAGAKSLKLKSKAKAVSGQLKNISVKNKDKIQAIDKELVNLEGKMRLQVESNKKQQKVVKNPAEPDQHITKQKEFEQTQEDSNKVVNNLGTMQL